MKKIVWFGIMALLAIVPLIVIAIANKMYVELVIVLFGSSIPMFVLFICFKEYIRKNIINKKDTLRLKIKTNKGYYCSIGKIISMEQEHNDYYILVLETYKDGKVYNGKTRLTYNQKQITVLNKLGYFPVYIVDDGSCLVALNLVFLLDGKNYIWRKSQKITDDFVYTDTHILKGQSNQIVEYFYTDELGTSYKNKEKISKFDIDYFKTVKRLPLARKGKKVFINYAKL